MLASSLPLTHLWLSSTLAYPTIQSPSARHPIWLIASSWSSTDAPVENPAPRTNPEVARSAWREGTKCIITIVRLTPLRHSVYVHTGGPLGEWGLFSEPRVLLSSLPAPLEPVADQPGVNREIPCGDYGSDCDDYRFESKVKQHTSWCSYPRLPLAK